MEDNYLVIEKKILPEIYLKVVKAKELLRTGTVRSIGDAAKEVGISRSAYYKYHQSVFEFKDSAGRAKKVAISFMLSHQHGVLSRVLAILAQNHANILSIHQGVPINNFATVNITFDIASMVEAIDVVIDEIRLQEGVSKLEIQAMGF